MLHVCPRLTWDRSSENTVASAVHSLQRNCKLSIFTQENYCNKTDATFANSSCVSSRDLAVSSAWYSVSRLQTNKRTQTTTRSHRILLFTTPNSKLFTSWSLWMLTCHFSPNYWRRSFRSVFRPSLTAMDWCLICSLHIDDSTAQRPRWRRWSTICCLRTVWCQLSVCST